MELDEKLKKNRVQLSKEYRLALKRELYRQSFYDFFKDAVYILRPNDNWSFNFHHEYLANLLQKEAIRVKDKLPKTNDYLINIPPRSSKSNLISICFNAWTWGCVSPYFSFLNISHSEELAVELAGSTKDLIESYWYKELFPHIQIRQDLTARSNFKNTLGGQRLSYSIGANVTGMGADFLLIDDPHDAKNVSDIKLDTTVKTYRETLFNRLNDPKVGCRILIGQRVHESDLFGHLLSRNQNGKYFHVCLPIELTEDVKPVELRGKYENGVLWHDHFPTESFSDLTDSEYVFATQYLQSPKPVGGGIVKEDWLEQVDSAPGAESCLFVDSALTGKKTNDPSALLIAVEKDNIVYIKHSGQYWLEFPDLIRKIKELATVHQIKKIYIEPKASGLSIAQQLRRETMLNVIELEPPKDSKMSRLQSVTPKLESKRVKIVKAGWNENFLYELTTFPNAKHDDQLDCLVYAVQRLLGEQGKISWYM